MEFFFGDELLNVLLQLFKVLLQFDLKSFDFRLHLFSSRGADISIEVDLGKITLENILH